MSMYYFMISSEALADPTVLDTFRPIKVIVDQRPSADAPVWHRFFFSFMDHQLDTALRKFKDNLIEGWYAIAWNKSEVRVLFKDEQFILAREEDWKSPEYKAMQAYAIDHGVQGEFIDFNERFEHYSEVEDYKLTQHVALTVNDMQESVEWYTKKLDAVVTHSYVKDDMEMTQMSIDDVRLELFHFNDTKPLPDYHQNLTDDLHTVGTKHLCIQTSHFEETVTSLKKKGVEFVMDIDSAAFSGSYIFFRDCNGILIELYGQ